MCSCGLQAPIVSATFRVSLLSISGDFQGIDGIARYWKAETEIGECRDPLLSLQL